MIGDRDYMREDPAPGRLFRFDWPATIWLMIVTAVLFVAQVCATPDYGWFIQEYLGLSRAGLVRGFVWQLLTFQFLHGGILHLLMNLISLWSFGRFVEERCGVRRFLLIYFTTGICGGLLQAALGMVLEYQLGGVVFGASAGIAGLVAVYCAMEPDGDIAPFFLKARYVLLILLVASAVFAFARIGPTIAHAAHLGGLLAGLAWTKLGWHRDFVVLPWEGMLGRWSRWRPLQNRQRKKELVSAAKVRPDAWRRPRPEPASELPPEEFIRREVDPILDKISAHGIQSLTERERKILETAPKRMSKS